MGVGYYVDVSQWDRGEYTGSNNAGAGANYNKGPDDLAIITTYNGFGYKADDHGDNAANASLLTVVGSNVSASGVITTRTDTDYFRFNTAGGNVTLNVSPAAIGANLDIEASLFDSNGVLVASDNALQALNASITANLAAGAYFLKIDGVGAGTPTAPTPTGYSDYASIGQYTISGTLAPAGGDSLSIVATDASKNEGNSAATAYTFTVNRTGDVSGTTTVSYNVAGSGNSPATAADFVGGAFASGSLTFAPNELSKVITVEVLGDTTVESNETFAVNLSNASPTTIIAVASATGTIINDDTPPAPPTLAISATSAIKAEGTGSTPTPFRFTVTRSGNTTGTSSVRFTVSGTGTNRASNNDFVNGFPQNVLVNFAAGVSAVDIVLNVRADSTREANETFRVALSSPVGATITVASANGTIQNDDGTRAAGSEDEEGQVELIAVADPLWMFVPEEFLTAEQLAVPVMTSINGDWFVGDLAHEHEHEHDHETVYGILAELGGDHDHEHLVGLVDEHEHELLHELGIEHEHETELGFVAKSASLPATAEQGVIAITIAVPQDFAVGLDALLTSQESEPQQATEFASPAHWFRM